MDENKINDSAAEQENEAKVNERVAQFNTADYRKRENYGNAMDDEITETLISDESVTAKKKRKWLIPGVLVGAIAVIVILVLVPQEIKANSVQKQLILGESFLEEGNYAEARLAYDKAIEIDPKAVQAYEKKAETYLLEDDYNEAENLLKTAQDIKQTSYGNLLLGEVYYETGRPEKGSEKMTEVAESSELDYETAQKAGDLLSKQNDYALLETLYENSLTKVKDKEERQGIYENLLETYLLQGKTEAELSVLVKRAQDEIGADEFTIERITDINKLEIYLNLYYAHWWAGLPNDFSAASEIDLNWLISMIVAEQSKNINEVKQDKEFTQKYKVQYFLSLEDIESEINKIVNPTIELPEYTQDYEKVITATWIKDKNGFGWMGKGSSAPDTHIMINEAFKLNNKIYLNASELMMKDEKNGEYHSSGDRLNVFCNNTRVGTAIYDNFVESTKLSEYTFSIDTDKIQTWTYVLQEKQDGGYFIISKMKNAN